MAALIVRRTPTRALSVVEPMDLFEDIDRMAADFWNEWTPSFHYHYRRSSIPVDMYELGDDLVIKAELPGFRREDIDISLDGDGLTIKAEKKQEEVPDSTPYYRSEICYGEYSRTMTLPFPVNSEKVLATFEHGMLEVKLPKAEEAKSKHITVTVK